MMIITLFSTALNVAVSSKVSIAVVVIRELAELL